MANILVIDDNPTNRETYADVLESEGHTVLTAGSGEEGLAKMTGAAVDAVLCDLKLPSLDGLATMELAHERHGQIPWILITGHGNEDIAVSSIKNGAFNYLTKPVDLARLKATVESAVRMASATRENKVLRRELGYDEALDRIVGTSSAVKQMKAVIKQVSASDASVLIEGESGTGKELVAEAIHYNSPRKGKPLVKMSCSVFPETLIEDELFGHVKGAFTDAKTDKSGRFERAHTGTIFIDDIDDLQPIPQVKLLRVLQEREFERIGATEPIKIDVRVVVATKKDLWQLVQGSTFREDLFHRLNVVKVHIPPLRERGEDIPLLVAHFLKKYSKGREFTIASEVLESLQSYSWPGNVRELEHAIERGIALAGSDPMLKKEHLLRPLNMAGTDVPPTGKLSTLKETVAEAEARHIRSVVAYTHGHRGEASRILGITRKNLWEKMSQYGIEG